MRQCASCINTISVVLWRVLRHVAWSLSPYTSGRTTFAVVSVRRTTEQVVDVSFNTVQGASNWSSIVRSVSACLSPTPLLRKTDLVCYHAAIMSRLRCVQLRKRLQHITKSSPCTTMDASSFSQFSNAALLKPDSNTTACNVRVHTRSDAAAASRVPYMALGNLKTMLSGSFASSGCSKLSQRFTA